jgi:hypothetical protein
MKKFQVLGETYALNLVKGLMDDDGCEGYCDAHNYAIFVDASLMKNKRVFRRVLLHELCHAYAYESGLHEFLSGQALEQFCQTASSFIDSLMNNNAKRKAGKSKKG